MNRRSFIQLSSASLLTLPFASHAFPDNIVDQARVERVIAGLPTRQRAAQLLLTYPQLDKTHPVELGGVLFVGRMLEDRDTAKALIANSVQRARVRPFFAVDMEGGTFNRMSNHPALRGLPSARQMARLPDAEVAGWGEKVGRAMKGLGLNMNLAPVFDVASSGHMFDNQRAFSGKAEVVAAKATAFARGLVLAGVAPIGKHYPGYGSVSGDSDHHIVHSPIARDTLDAHQRVFLKAQDLLAGVMMSNIAYDSVGPKPAFLSETLISEAQAQGWLTVTDDLSIGALARFVGGDPADVVRGALLAGNDLLLTTAPPDWDKGLDYVGILTHYAENDAEANQRVNAACRRVLGLKDRMGLLEGL